MAEGGAARLGGRRDARYQPNVTDLDQFLEPLQRNEVLGSGKLAVVTWLEAVQTGEHSFVSTSECFATFAPSKSQTQCFFTSPSCVF